MKSESCIFCDIINKKIKSQVLAENDRCIAFKDVNPVADFHALVVPKVHIASFNELSKDFIPYVSDMMSLAHDLVKSNKLESHRLVINTGKDAGQSVFHIHLHVLANRTFSWPPG